MKKINILIIVLFSVFTLNSCEDITDENNTTSASFDTLEEYVDAVLPSVYASLRSVRVYKQFGFNTSWGDAGVDIIGVASFNPFHLDLYGYRFSPGLQAISETWLDYYKGVATANNFLAILNDFQVDAGQLNLKNQAIAEARFIRALLYFDMVKIWSDIPLVIAEDATLAGVRNNSEIPNSPAEEIYVQIEKDLLFAEQFAMSKVEAGSQDIVSQQAATALLSKVYLQMTTKTQFGGVEGGIDSDGNAVTVQQRYIDAKNAIEKILGAYELEENYADVFAIENERTNTEVIFSVGFDGPNQQVGSDYGDQLGPVGDGVNGAFNFYRINIDLAFDYLKPDEIVHETEKLTNGFAMPDGEILENSTNFSREAILLDPHNFISDTRFEQNVARFIATSLKDFREGSAPASVTKFGVMNVNTGAWQVLKYPKPIPNPNSNGNGQVDFPYLRYADILLMYAEILNELGETNQAYFYLNLVRRRAFKTQILKEIPEFIDPNAAPPKKPIVYVTPNPRNNIAGTSQSDLNNTIANNMVEIDVDGGERDVPLGLSKEEFLDAILLERKLELCFEGKRKDDLLRTGKIQEAINTVRENSVNLADPIPSVNFDLTLHTHWPIPTREINLNKNLKQNCAYASSGAGCF